MSLSSQNQRVWRFTICPSGDVPKGLALPSGTSIVSQKTNHDCTRAAELTSASNDVPRKCPNKMAYLYVNSAGSSLSLPIKMILAFLLMLTNLVLCLCTEYYAEYNPLWKPEDEGLSIKLFYKENGSAVPDDLAAELLNPKTRPPDMEVGKFYQISSFEIRVPENILQKMKDTDDKRERVQVEKPPTLTQWLMNRIISPAVERIYLWHFYDKFVRGFVGNSSAQEKRCGGMRYIREAGDGSTWHVTVKVWSTGPQCDTMAVADAIADRIDQDVAIAHTKKMKQWSYSIDEGGDWRADICYTKEGYNLNPWGPPRI